MFAQVFLRWTALLAVPTVAVYLASLGLSDVRAQDIRDTQIERIAREITTQVTSHGGDLARGDEVAAVFSRTLRERLDEPLTDQQVREVLHALRQRGFQQKRGEDLEIRGLKWAYWIEHQVEDKQLAPVR